MVDKGLLLDVLNGVVEVAPLEGLLVLGLSLSPWAHAHIPLRPVVVHLRLQLLNESS